MGARTRRRVGVCRSTRSNDMMDSKIGRWNCARSRRARTRHTPAQPSRGLLRDSHAGSTRALPHARSHRTRRRSYIPILHVAGFRSVASPVVSSQPSPSYRPSAHRGPCTCRAWQQAKPDGVAGTSTDSPHPEPMERPRNDKSAPTHPRVGMSEGAVCRGGLVVSSRVCGSRSPARRRRGGRGGCGVPPRCRTRHGSRRPPWPPGSGPELEPRWEPGRVWR